MRAALGVEHVDLVGDNYTCCQQLAQAAYAAGLDGPLSPSAALPDCRTLAVFTRALPGPALTADHSRIQRPPATLVDVLHAVRPTGPNTAAVRELFRRLQDARRRRRAGHTQR